MDYTAAVKHNQQVYSYLVFVKRYAKVSTRKTVDAFTEPERILC